MLKDAAKQLQRDWIPDGVRNKAPAVDIHDKQFRHTSQYEVYRCCRQSNYDPQSGPIYCGRVAEYITVELLEGGYVVALCENHKPRLVV